MSDPIAEAERVVAAEDPARGAAPLVARLAASEGAGWVAEAGLAAFLATPGEQVLFFHGDPVRFPEAVDVAVVLPELRRQLARRHGRALAVGVVTRADEDRLAARYGVQRWPSLVFLRDGRYVDVIAGMLDWQDYVDRLAALVDLPASRPPIALKSGAGAAAGCH